MHRARQLGVGTVGAAVGCYVGYVALTYVRFGRRAAGQAPGTNSTLLDGLMPEYDVREVHHVRVAAPADHTLAAARTVSFADSPLIRAIFALRTLSGQVRGEPVAPVDRRSIVEVVTAGGWRQIAEVPGRQLNLGAVTQPWTQAVHFRGLPTDVFAAFREPGCAKIAVTFEAEPRGPSTSEFRTETRVFTTDPHSRERFRRYWAVLSPGILLIHYELLRLVKANAEHSAARMSEPGGAPVR